MRYVVKHVELGEYQKCKHIFKICDSIHSNLKYFRIETEIVLPKNSFLTNKATKHENQKIKEDTKIEIKTWALGSVENTHLCGDYLIYKREKYQIFIIQDKELMAITHLTQINLREDEIEIVCLVYRKYFTQNH